MGHETIPGFVENQPLLVPALEQVGKKVENFQPYRFDSGNNASYKGNKTLNEQATSDWVQIGQCWTT